MKIWSESGINWFWDFYDNEDEARAAATAYAPTSDDPYGSAANGGGRWSIKQLNEPITKVRRTYNAKAKKHTTENVVLPAGTWVIHQHY